MRSLRDGMELTKIADWLSAFPAFRGYTFQEDVLPTKPNVVSLLNPWTQEADRIEDLLGNWKKTMELSCTVAFCGYGGSQKLLALQHWVARQDALGGVPQLGQGRKSARLEKGKRLQESPLGVGVYTAQLTLTYEMYYEVNENGEN